MSTSATLCCPHREVLILVISGPGGAGKGTVASRLVERDPGAVAEPVVDDAAARPGEVRRRLHVRRPRDVREARRRRAASSSGPSSSGNLYGTPHPDAPRGQGRVLEIDLQGAPQVRRRHPDALVVLLLSRRRPRVQAERLRRRGDDEAEVARRLDRGADEERVGGQLTPFVVVNDDVDRAVAQVAGILDSHRRLPPDVSGRRRPWRSLMPQRRSTLMDPPIEDLLDKVDSKFTLVALSAKRARQINSYYNQLGEGLGVVVPPQVTSVSGKPLTIAFEEVAASKATYHRIEPSEVSEDDAEAAEAASGRTFTARGSAPSSTPSLLRSPPRSCPTPSSRSRRISRRPASSRSIHNGTNKGGTFTFSPSTTGNANASNSPGDAMASFYLGAVANATTSYYNVPAEYPRQYTNTVHFGDNWHVAPRLTVNLGLRWDYMTPFSDKYNNLTFFDPNGPNPGAINSAGQELPGRLAYAGKSFGSASYGANYPEIPFKAGWAPRVGFAYTVDSKTVVRAGYGIYYGRAFYPGWNGGESQDGFNKNVNLNQTASGGFQIPVLYLANGISAAQTGSTKSVISSSFDNGANTPNYRPLDGNRRPYSQQWNLTLERQLPSNFFISVSYVGTKGTHLPSDLSPINALNPNNATVQALGPHLNDSFTANEASVDGVSQPYVGWAAQLISGGGCTPTVGQALAPYPMFCGVMQGQNEQHATSIYNSFQAKVERHMTHGLYVLGVLTTSKMYTDGSDTVQSGNDNGTGNQGNNGQFSPYNLKPRAWAIVPDNVPITGQISAIYTLPFGKGEKWVNDNAMAEEIVGGWRVTPLFHYDYGTPFSFYSSTCATKSLAPGLREGCIPGISPARLCRLADATATTRRAERDILIRQP